MFALGFAGCAGKSVTLGDPPGSVHGKTDAGDVSLAHDFFLRARSMELEGNPRVALEYYQIAHGYDPGSRDLCFLLVDRLRDAGKADSAIALGRGCFMLKEAPTSGEYQSVGQAYLEKDDARGALPYYREAVDLDDDDPDALYVLAAIYEKLNDLPHYAEVSKKLLPQIDYPSRLVDKLLQTYAALHQPDSAEAVLRLAWQDGNRAEFGEELASYYEARSRYHEFREVAEELARQNPDVPAYEVMRAQALKDADMPDSALAVYRELSRREPENRDVQFAYAGLLEEQGARDTAYSLFKKLARENPENASYHYSLGATGLELRRKESGAELERAVSLDPAEPDYWARSIYADLVFGRDSAAAFRLSHLPDSMNLGWQTSFFHGLVRVLIARQLEPREDAGDSAPLRDSLAAREYRGEAAGLFRDALDKSPDNPLVLFELGSDLERLGQRDSGMRVLRALVKTDTSNAVAMNYLAYMLVEDGSDLDFAGKLLDRALSLDPENGAYLDSKGWWYYRKGDLSSARSELQQALQHLPKDPTVLEHLAKVLEGLGEKDGAYALWERLLSVDPRNAEARDHAGK